MHTLEIQGSISNHCPLHIPKQEARTGAETASSVEVRYCSLQFQQRLRRGRLGCVVCDPRSCVRIMHKNQKLYEGYSFHRSCSTFFDMLNLLSLLLLSFRRVNPCATPSEVLKGRVQCAAWPRSTLFSRGRGFSRLYTYYATTHCAMS